MDDAREETQLITAEPPVRGTSPADMLAAAIAHGIDAQGIKTLAEVFERMQAQQAEQSFNRALASFQNECPVVLKNSTVEFPTRAGGKFESRYASIDNIIEATRPLRAKYGFSFTFDRDDNEREIASVCILRHEGGHKTKTRFGVPFPKDNRLSEAHGIAGAVTFCERYALRAALGITTGMPDNDGKGFTNGNTPISSEQVATLQALLDQTKAEGEAFWNFCGVRKLGDLHQRDYARVEQALQQRKRRMAE